MRTICTVSLVVLLLVLADGCATTPEHLVSRTEDAQSGSLGGSLNAPIGGKVAGISAYPMVNEGFAVLEFRAKRDERGAVFVIGEVKNVGTATQGVELEVVLRDREDRALAVGRLCPAANHSIAPNDTQPFAYSLGRHEDGVRAELRIVRTFYTMDTLGIAALPR